MSHKVFIFSLQSDSTYIFSSEKLLLSFSFHQQYLKMPLLIFMSLSFGRHIISVDNPSLFHIILINLNLHSISLNNSNMRLFHLPCLIARNYHISILKFNHILPSRKLFQYFTISFQYSSFSH